MVEVDRAKAERELGRVPGFLRAEVAPQKGGVSGLPTVRIVFDTHENLDKAIPTIANLALDSFETDVEAK